MISVETERHAKRKVIAFKGVKRDSFRMNRDVRENVRGRERKSVCERRELRAIWGV